MSSTTKFHWMSWMSHILRQLGSNDIDLAANGLACCLDGNSDIDEHWRPKMFQHPKVLARIQELWPLMKPLITPVCLEEVQQNLSDFGWDIS